ncbi:MAG: sugar nucleotide-binding protein [Candidatus Pacebacteria bacterium]|jgi:dTDP-4-dehydrorhamnose reductase|nr:sugar nucleotide-binding protein [Candidatus Paceibacterota bacterium]MBT4004756.1 sugar nucleotide-binding protein [Candidatus Paceibacterota bacterium]MBT6899253.1 sugar nucleotide-binding protein [Candidatus Paceibacterota bacterium]MBT7184153.1 sugar nucleotide-binding protein [Candidatus Paceibacterota bacterium]MBT7310015.1 sugar nucleotide-binding protein [Candidatus Paceibacterota bacterium]
MKVAIIGASGFVGSYLFNFFTHETKFTTIGTAYKNHLHPYFFLDIRDPVQLSSFFVAHKPEIIIWLSAIKNVTMCEIKPKHAYSLNVKPIDNLIQIIKKNNLSCQVIYLSSDYVFDGEKGNYTEFDRRNPKTIYGKTKFQAETLLENSQLNFFIVRTSSIIARESMFVEWLNNELSSNKNVKLLSNSFISPTPISFLLKVIGEIAESKVLKSRHLHCVTNIKMSRFELGKKISKILALGGNIISSNNRSLIPYIQRDLSLIQSFEISHCQKKSFDKYLRESLFNIR